MQMLTLFEGWVLGDPVWIFPRPPLVALTPAGRDRRHYGTTRGRMETMRFRGSSTPTLHETLLAVPPLYYYTCKEGGVYLRFSSACIILIISVTDFPRP